MISIKKRIGKCRKLPSATDKRTTSHTVVPTLRITEDVHPYSRTEVTIETITYSTT